ncbi:hypothetical protein AN640_01165 [Candidatus Epulonipiscium fishelsonii]|uniref:Uncharacterized protein n=1 Tax=Candidatus Epulonipiscium fishelsonii TaxID=77094 RepID=A0ACC8XID5_9FIRM|nr:hypothetical protein AN640_01165 [Epulopiscium sp. SCG-D08WGA-EpuloA1]OON90883.1 MAG: hypothetical protein ATN32_03000 [Epulopiscium sp. AS2M-Bin002]
MKFNKIKKAIMLNTLLLPLFIMGCSNNSAENLDLEQQVSTLENQLLAEQEKNKKLQSQLIKLESDVRILLEAIQNPNSSVFLDDIYNENLLKVYTIDASNMETKIVDKLFVQDNLEDNLDFLANSLSKNVFENLDIEILGIENIDDKKIAYIDLQDEVNIPVTWTTFFQGSTGGKITTDSLKMTFLQPTYPYEWIDGISLTYEGAPIQGDHVEELASIIYR